MIHCKVIQLHKVPGVRPKPPVLVPLSSISIDCPFINLASQPQVSAQNKNNSKRNPEKPPVVFFSSTKQRCD